MPSWTGWTTTMNRRITARKLEYYSSLNPPYVPRNGPLQTVEELLLVRGVTPQLLFGLDTNRNGLIDTHEMSTATGTVRPAV